MSRALVALGVLIALAHFGLVAWAYPALPPAIPSFQGLDGSVLKAMPKTPLTACRLPLMGLITQAACWLMLPHRPVLWAGVAALAGAKLGLESLTLLGVASRPAVAAVSAAGVVLLAWAAWREHRQGVAARSLAPAAKVALAVAGACYVVVVAMPWWPTT